jgi:hypothetical protein
LLLLNDDEKTMNAFSIQRRNVAALIGAILLGGCATFEAEGPVREGMDEMRTGKMTVPTKVMTNFSGALRCMDRQFSDFGIKDLHVMVEDLNDRTAKVPAGATDMFITSMSQMTTRSQAIKFKAFGEDTKNLSAFLRTSGTKGPYQPQNLPDFVIRGSISQFDDNILKKNVDLGASIGDAKTTFLSAGFTRSATGRELGMDLSVQRTSDLGLVPGVTSHNSMFLMSTGTGLDTEAGYKKLGVSFLTSLSRMEGNSRALRNLVELSAIELMGKLAKIPYWRCLDIPNDTKEVQAEIEDWHEGLWADGPTEAVAYYQHHFNVLGMLPKYERGKMDDDFKFALRVYKKALGLELNGKVNLALFKAHLTSDRENLWKIIGPLYKAEYKERLMVRVRAVEPAPYKLGQPVNLIVAPHVPALVSCFIMDEENKIHRIWRTGPRERASPDAPPAPIELPKGLLKIDPKGRPMQVSCFTFRNDPSNAAIARTPHGAQVLTGSTVQTITAAKSMMDIVSVFQASGQEVQGHTIFLKGEGNETRKASR